MSTDRPKPLATDDTITLPIPGELAARFILDDASTPRASRGYALLRLGSTDLGYWRIDDVASRVDEIGTPRIVATLRRVLP